MQRKLLLYLSVFFLTIALVFSALLISANAMQAFGIIQMQGGEPAFDRSLYPVSGWVHCGQKGNYGIYIVSGTAAQLSALATLPEVYPICALKKGTTTDANGVTTDNWQTALDTAITSARRTKINTKLTQLGWPTIPAGTTVRQVINQVFKRFNVDWDRDEKLHQIADLAD